MIFLLNIKSNKIPVFMNKTSTAKGWDLRGNDLYFNGDKYTVNKKRSYMISLHPFIQIDDDLHYRNKDDRIIVIYESYHNKNEEIFVIDDKIIAMRVSNENDIKNLIFGIKNEYKYIVNHLILKTKARHSFQDKNIEGIVPTNIVVSLNKLEQLDGLGEWFVNTKLDGTTAVLAYIKYLDTIVAYELKQKGLDESSAVLIKPRVINTDLSPNSVVFMGEYLDGNIYLFLECDDNYHDYNIDIKHMTLFVDKCNQVGIKEIQLNTIVVAGKNESYKDITRKILNITPKGSTDGLVYGRISDKYQLKWKPVGKNTIDLRVIYDGQDIYLYAAENMYTALKRIKTDKRIKRMKVHKDMLIKGSGKYVDLLWDYRKNIGVDSEHRKLYHNKICECVYVDGFWSPVKIREDKVFPNNYKIADNIFYTIKHPITLENLIE